MSPPDQEAGHSLRLRDNVAAGSGGASRALWLLGLAATAIRLAYVLATRNHALAWGDEFTYDSLATHLLRDHCYGFQAGHPTVTRAPLYAMLLAGMYAVFGHRFLPVFIVQAIAGGLSAPLLARIGVRVSGSARVGLLAGWLLALNPLFIFTVNLLYTETFYLLLLLCLVALWQKMLAVSDSARPAPTGLAVGSGLLLGLSDLMKPNMLLFPLFLLLWAVLASRDRRRSALAAACVAVAMLIPVLPWTLRNHRVSGQWVPVSANSGMNLAQGNNSRVRGGTGLQMDKLDPFPGLSEVQRDQAYWRQGRQWIVTHPLGFLRLACLKVGAFFSPLMTTSRGHLASRLEPLLVVACLSYYGLALIGWIVTRRCWRDWLLIALLVLYPALLTVIFYGGTRYGMPAQPFIMLYCAQGMIWLTARANLLPPPGAADPESAKVAEGR